MPEVQKRPTVYLETSVVSFLAARRSADPAIAEFQEATRRWWEQRRQGFELCVSPLVIEEASLGDPIAAARRLALLRGVVELGRTAPVEALAAALMSEGAVPPEAPADAAHVAFSAVHGVDVLLTWNCRHIANPVKRPAIEAVCRHNGYEPPRILTPAEALAEE